MQDDPDLRDKPGRPTNGEAIRALLDSEQARCNGYVRPMHHPVAGEILVSGSPITLNGEIPGWAEPPPEHGQHTEEVLLKVGYSWEEISQMRDSGTI